MIKPTLNYASRERRRRPMRRWIYAHIGGSYLAMVGMALYHFLSFFPNPHAYSMIDTRLDVVMAIFAPLWVPFALIVVPWFSAAGGHWPTAGFLWFGGAYVTGLLVIARIIRAPNAT